MIKTMVCLCCTSALAGQIQAEAPALRLRFPGASRSIPVVQETTRIRVPGLYPGIDAVFYNNHGETEYDFIVTAHADPSTIRIAFDGARSIELTHEGDIHAYNASNTIEQRRPFAYQESSGSRKQVPCRYRLGEDRQVRLELGPYDLDAVLVIDPVVKSSFYIGGGLNTVTAIAGITTDSSGYTYIAGTTSLAGFPVTPGPLSHYNGSRDPAVAGDVFVVKLAPATNAVVFAVLVGGSGDDVAAGIAVDSLGNVYVSGYTTLPIFPRLRLRQTRIWQHKAIPTCSCSNSILKEPLWSTRR